MKLFKTITSQARVMLGIRTAEERAHDMLAEKRPVFSRAVKKLPFYSLNRVRNQIIVACASMIYMFWDPLAGIYRGHKRGKALEAERNKFIKELDALDRAEDGSTK